MKTIEFEPKKGFVLAKKEKIEGVKKVKGQPLPQKTIVTAVNKEEKGFKVGDEIIVLEGSWKTPYEGLYIVNAQGIVAKR